MFYFFLDLNPLPFYLQSWTIYFLDLATKKTQILEKNDSLGIKAKKQQQQIFTSDYSIFL